MAGNQEVVDFPLLSAPIGSEVYGVKSATDYRVAVGSALGLATLGADGKLDAAQMPAVGGSGTVTSVGLSVGTGISLTGASPITTSGSWALALSANLQSWSAIAPSAKADASHTHHVNDLTATGTKDNTTFLRGDNTWAVPAGGGGGGGSVTSVNASGGTTGMSFTGGPVTTSGTLTLGGTLAVANGGTGSATAAAARTALGVAATSHTHSAADIVSGTIATARLGSGTANSGTYLRGDGTWAAVSGGSGGTVTSVDISGGTGITASGGPITGSGTLSVTLSSNLQGWSGIAPAAKADASHTHAAGDVTSGVFSTARLGTGTADSTKYLRGDGTWQTLGTGAGTVTSVAATVPTGFSISGSPITTSGTLALTYTAGYQGFTSAESTKLAGIAAGATANTGTVTSINISGGTSGLTATGGPITTSGTITLGGTLDITNGGTNATTAAAARTNLGAAPTASPTFTGTTTFAGSSSVDSGGKYYSGGSIFSSLGATAIFSTGSAGTLYLRPNGEASTTGQVTISSAGVMTFLEEPLITNADGTGTVRVPRTFVQSGDPGADAEDGDLWLF